MTRPPSPPIVAFEAVRAWCNYSRGRYRAVVIAAAVAVVGIPVATNIATGGPVATVIANSSGASTTPPGRSATVPPTDPAADPATDPGVVDTSAPEPASTKRIDPDHDDDLTADKRVTNDITAMVRGFAAAYLAGRTDGTSDLTAAAWANLIAPYVTSDVLESLGAVNRADMPTAALQAVKVTAASDAAGAAAATLTDGSILEIDLQWDGAGWLVAFVDAQPPTEQAPTRPTTKPTTKPTTSEAP